MISVRPKFQWEKNSFLLSEKLFLGTLTFEELIVGKKKFVAQNVFWFAESLFVWGACSNTNWQWNRMQNVSFRLKVTTLFLQYFLSVRSFFVDGRQSAKFPWHTVIWSSMLNFLFLERARHAEQGRDQEGPPWPEVFSQCQSSATTAASTNREWNSKATEENKGT